MSEELILMPYQDLPFNGDLHAMKEFINMKEKYGLNVAVETGSCFFSTTKFLAENFEKVLTFEIVPKYYQIGLQKVADMHNVGAFNTDSVSGLKEQLKGVDSLNQRLLFFLDAHWEQNCPLLDELQVIADSVQYLRLMPVIVIHDFVVPDHPELGFDTYNGKSFDFDFIKEKVIAIEKAYGNVFEVKYNSEATGAMRGIIYLIPYDLYKTAELREPESPSAIEAMEGLKEQTEKVPMPELSKMAGEFFDVEQQKRDMLAKSENTSGLSDDELRKMQIEARINRFGQSTTPVIVEEMMSSQAANAIDKPVTNQKFENGGALYKINEGAFVSLAGFPVKIESTVIFKASPLSFERYLVDLIPESSQASSPNAHLFIDTLKYVFKLDENNEWIPLEDVIIKK